MKKTNKSTKKTTAKANGGQAAQASKNVSRTVRDTKKMATDCLCGCGKACGRNFLPGHDQRLKGLLIRVNSGKAQPSEIPAVAIANRHKIGFAETGIYRAVLQAATPKAKVA
jgi:hypothetical protein